MAPVTVGYYDETEADSAPPSSTNPGKPTVRGREADRARAMARRRARRRARLRGPGLRVVSADLRCGAACMRLPVGHRVEAALCFVSVTGTGTAYS